MLSAIVRGWEGWGVGGGALKFWVAYLAVRPWNTRPQGDETMLLQE